MSRRDQEAKTTIEVQATKVARAEADQASGSHDQLVDENKATGSHSQLIEESQKLSILIHEKPRSTCSWQDRLNSLKLGPENENPASRIQKVPFMLRENKEFEKYYKPKMVAIGPIHHRDPNFEFTEKRKHIVAGDFIKEHGIDAEYLYDKIMDGLGNLKMRYVEDVIKDYTDDELAWMFLVDGCAILHFIHCVVNDDPQYSAKLEKFNFKKNQVAYAQQDLFLFENQLPYQLLELLISSVVQNKEKEDIRESIRKFIDMNLITPKSRQRRRKPSENPRHLLKLLWEELTDGVLPRSGGRPMHSFRNVKELMTSGIQLKASSENSLNISFNQFCFTGTLQIPSLVVDDSTAAKFLNLIAYEMCPDFMNDFQVTSYICFLDSLIDHPEDVQELRKAKILINVLGSDNEVAELFNKIGNDLVPNPDIYGTVKDNIEKYYNSKWTTYSAEAYHSYFSSPWTFLAFLGALLGLFFSAVQAYFSLPSKSC